MRVYKTLMNKTFICLLIVVFAGRSVVGAYFIRLLE